MKKKIVLLFIISFTSSLTVANDTLARIPYLFIENHYTAPVTCIVNNTRSIKINNDYNIVWLGQIHIPNQPDSNLTVTSLSIPSDYYGETSLNNKLEEISQQYAQNPGKDAVLIIEPVSRFSSWSIKLTWRNPSGVVSSISTKSEEDLNKTIERQLQQGKLSPQQFLEKIEHNAYGINDNGYDLKYAQSLKLMREVDYNKIQKKHYDDLAIYGKLKNFGYPALLTALWANIQNPYSDYMHSPNAQWTQASNKTPKQVRAIVKELIDKQFELYWQYKNNGWLE